MTEHNGRAALATKCYGGVAEGYKGVTKCYGGATPNTYSPGEAT